MKYTRNAKIIMFGLMLSILVLIVSWLIMGDLKQTSNTQKFINEVNEYQNPDHKAYCEKAISGEASEAHLKEEGCIK